MIQILITVTSVLLLVYAILIYYYHRIWDGIPDPADSGNSPSAGPLYLLNSQPDSLLRKDQPLPMVKVSVIIPARNEGHHIENCLKSLFSQSYPKNYTEIIVVNDFSTDDTVALVEQYPDQCLLLHLSEYISDP
ncbi:MAG TPA: glycosyltransferase family 2 protein, partial [Puia sp.]